MERRVEAVRTNSPKMPDRETSVLSNCLLTDGSRVNNSVLTHSGTLLRSVCAARFNVVLMTLRAFAIDGITDWTRRVKRPDWNRDCSSSFAADETMG
jgi:hypothetical protein